MIQKEFNNIVTKEIEHCKDILISKGAEYAPGAIKGTAADRLAHFRKTAVLMDSTPKAALMGMLSKHLVSVSDMCVGDRKYTAKQWDEKITDSICYLLILRALAEEETSEEN